VPGNRAADSREITITIEHIEVRAVPPPKQDSQRTRARFRPGVSLTDFLAQGADGRR
jgi:hypothetical protein